MALFRRSAPPPPGNQGAAPRPVTAVELLSRLPGPALVVAASGEVLRANPAAERLTGLTQGQRPDAAWWTELFAWLARSDGGSAPYHLSRIDTPAGMMSVEWTAAPLITNAVGLIGRDVTMEQNLKQALAESRQRFRDLADIACDLAWEVDAEGCFTYVTAEGGFGHAAQALIGRPATMLLAEGETLVRPVFEARQPVRHVRLTLRQADGHPVEVIAAARPLLGPDGAWRGARGICRVADSEILVLKTPADPADPTPQGRAPSSPAP